MWEVEISLLILFTYTWGNGAKKECMTVSIFIVLDYFTKIVVIKLFGFRLSFFFSEMLVYTLESEKQRPKPVTF